MGFLGSLCLCFQAYLLKQEESKLGLVNSPNCPTSEDSQTEAVQWGTDYYNNVRVGNMRSKWAFCPLAALGVGADCF